MFRALLLLLIAAPSVLLAGEPVPVAQFLKSAYAQIGKTVSYDPSYTPIAFPGGDVPIERGVCTDVVVRAYRGIGVDLQLLVHEDMRAAPGAYPKLWGLSRPDPNIDHRRVPNLAVFFARHGKVLPITQDARDYKPGDIVTWRLAGGLAHIGIVSDKQTGGGQPLVIHNIGAGAKLEDILFEFQVTGHYRYGSGIN
ncbi:MAG: DUF1287 domain-containing protein [Rhodomicrobium sp.]